MTGILLVAGLLAGGLVASEIGFRLARVSGEQKDEGFARHFDVIRSATFALVAFLIGFAFAGAGSRYVDRLDVVVKEANALGTAWLRADVLAEPQRSQLKSTLREYTADRLDLLRLSDLAEVEQRLARVGELQQRMWSQALQGVGDDTQRMRLLLPAINDVIDLHTTHLALAYRHLPTPILVVLLVVVGLSFVLVGFGSGRSGQRYLFLDGVYALILAVALWMTMDLDRPLHGLIQLNVKPLTDALAAMK